MSPVTHFLVGWVMVGGTSLRRREKAAVVAAAVAPDVDGLGAIPELLTRHSAHPLLWFSRYHHGLHTLAFAVLVTLAAFVMAMSPNFGRNRHNRCIPSHAWTTALPAFLAFHLHLLCDLAGSRGPDGDSWPIPYFGPFSDAGRLSWQGQWALNGWQNFAITGMLVATTLWIAWKYGRSPVELVSPRGNQAVVTALRIRFSKQQT